MAAPVETVHASLAQYVTRITPDVASSITQRELSDNLAAQVMANTLLEFGDPEALWVARWEEGLLKGEFGLLAGVSRRETDWPTYLQFRISPSEIYRQPGESSRGTIRCSTLLTAHDTVNAVLTEGLWRYSGPFRVLSFYKGIDQITSDGQVKAKIVKTSEKVPTQWHKDFGEAMGRKTQQSLEKVMTTTRFWSDLHFPA
jgi:hypothetical protein